MGGRNEGAREATGDVDVVACLNDCSIGAAQATRHVCSGRAAALRVRRPRERVGNGMSRHAWDSMGVGDLAAAAQRSNISEAVLILRLIQLKNGPLSMT